MGGKNAAETPSMPTAGGKKPEPSSNAHSGWHHPGLLAVACRPLLASGKWLARPVVLPKLRSVLQRVYRGLARSVHTMPSL
jgi:hypothetical protein